MPSGTGFLSPNAQAVPDREGMHPHAQDVPVEIGRPGLVSVQCRPVPTSAKPAPARPLPNALSDTSLVPPATVEAWR